MKRILVFSLLSCSLLVACTHSKPQRQTAHAPFGYTGPSTEYYAPEEVAPVESDAAAAQATPAPAPQTQASQAQQPAPTPVPLRREALPGIPVPGKPGMMKSPYHPEAGLIDYRGLPSGTEVKDPYTPGKSILVP